MKILVLPPIDRKKFLQSSNERTFFQYWPEESYHMNVIGAYKFSLYKHLTTRFLKFYPVQGLKAFFIRNRYDLVIACGSQSIVTIAFLRYFTGFKKPRLIVFDVEKLGRAKSGVKLYLIRKICKKIDLLVYYSRDQNEYYEKYVPELNGKTHFFHLGIIPEEKTLNWGESNNGDYIVALGTPQISRVKRKIRDWRTVIDAWGILNKDIKLKIFGQPYFTRKETNNRKIPETIKLHPAISKDKLTPIVEKAKFVILPLWETGHAQGQLSLLYLMSLGKAVIVGETTGIRDYVIDRETAIFYTPGNKNELAKKVNFLLENPKEIERIGRNAYDVVREKFCSEVLSRKLYDNMIKIITKNDNKD